MQLHHIDGRIINAVYDKDVFSTKSDGVEIYDIDEIAPDNKELCIDIVRSLSKTDRYGVCKYSIVDGVLHETEDWAEGRRDAE